MTSDEIVRQLTFQHFRASWLGRYVAKSPLDLWVYQEILFETRPDVLVECGTSSGGSAYFFARVFDLLGGGEVVTIDPVSYPDRPTHPRIRYVQGSSLAPTIREQVQAHIHTRSERVMVALDALHTYEHLTAELAAYAPLVTPGCYLVVEDVNPLLDASQRPARQAQEAVTDFLRAHPEFVPDATREKFLITCNTGGWLRRQT